MLCLHSLFLSPFLSIYFSFEKSTLYCFAFHHPDPFLMATTYTFPTSPVSPVSEVSEPHGSTASHSRNHSDVSSATLYTNAAPYEPLLPPICQSSSDAYEVVSNQSRRSGILSLAPSRWSQNDIRSRSASLRNEKALNMKDVPRSRTKQPRWIKSVLETIMSTSHFFVWLPVT